MPGFDGTGPAGMGPMTGGGRGPCTFFLYPGARIPGYPLPTMFSPVWPLWPTRVYPAGFFPYGYRSFWPIPAWNWWGRGRPGAFGGRWCW